MLGKGLKKYKDSNALLLDILDNADIASTSTISNYLQILRGIVDFFTDSFSPFHNNKLTKDIEIILVCGA
jgi:hypothetical protein